VVRKVGCWCFFLLFATSSCQSAIVTRERAVFTTMASRKTASAALASLALLPSAYSQFITPPTDLTETEGYYNQTVRYKQVPEGICELTPGVKSFSGYVDVAPEQSIFWWFFEARNGEPEDAPLTIWINGGPGSSSMIGLFEELGPCWINEAGEVQHKDIAWK
jgi:carboxypeptidase C (cathepsin A)